MPYRNTSVIPLYSPLLYCLPVNSFPSTSPFSSAFLPAIQRLEGEKQDVLCQAEQQQQDLALQMQCLQQACQDTVQHERARHGEQVLHIVLQTVQWVLFSRHTPAAVLQKSKHTHLACAAVRILEACLHMH